MSLNRAVITGRIVDDPETRYTNSDEPVTRLLVELGENTKLRLVCWRALAEKAKDLKAENIILASGSLLTSTFKTSSGANRKEIEMNVKDLYLLEGQLVNLNPLMAGAPASSAPQSKAPRAKSAKSSSQEEDLSDVFANDLKDEIPF